MERRALCGEGARLWADWFRNVCALGEVIGTLERDPEGSRRCCAARAVALHQRDRLLRHRRDCEACLATEDILALTAGLAWGARTWVVAGRQDGRAS